MCTGYTHYLNDDSRKEHDDTPLDFGVIAEHLAELHLKKWRRWPQTGGFKKGPWTIQPWSGIEYLLQYQEHLDNWTRNLKQQKIGGWQNDMEFSQKGTPVPS